MTVWDIIYLVVVAIVSVATIVISRKIVSQIGSGKTGRKTNNNYNMLINLSNHPSEGWGAAQKEAAGKYGRVVDIPFPAVPATATPSIIDNMANELVDSVKEVASENDVTVHVMGEQTLCYALISRLQELGIPCIASCTARNVVDLPDGSKQSRFEFVQFRSYIG